MTPDEMETLRVIVHAEMHSEEQATRKLRWPHRCVLVVVTFGVGVLLHHFIEDAGMRSAAQSVELSLSALYGWIFEKARGLS